MTDDANPRPGSTGRGWAHRKRMVRATGAVCLAAGLVSGVSFEMLPGQTRAAHPPRRAAEKPSPTYRPPTYRLTGTLVSFNGCSDYLSYVKRQAMAAVGPYGLDTYGLDTYGSGNYGPGGPEVGGIDSVAPATTSPGPVMGLGAAPAVGTASGPSSSSAAPTTGTFSQTNDQVLGVDEPDTVKTDGRIVVTLVGSTLRVLGLDAHVIGSLALAGDTGGGLFLDGSRAVVTTRSATRASVEGSTATVSTRRG